MLQQYRVLYIAVWSYLEYSCHLLTHPTTLFILKYTPMCYYNIYTQGSYRQTTCNRCYTTKPTFVIIQIEGKTSRGLFLLRIVFFNNDTRVISIQRGQCLSCIVGSMTLIVLTWYYLQMFSLLFRVHSPLYKIIGFFYLKIQMCTCWYLYSIHYLIHLILFGNVFAQICLVCVFVYLFICLFAYTCFYYNHSL